MEDILLLGETTLKPSDSFNIEKSEVIDENILNEVEILPEIITPSDLLDKSESSELKVSNNYLSNLPKVDKVKKHCVLFSKDKKKSIFGGTGNNILIGGIILSLVSILVK